MKKVKGALCLLLALGALVGCNGGQEPVYEWTAEEKELLEEYTEIDLPCGAGADVEYYDDFGILEVSFDYSDELKTKLTDAIKNYKVTEYDEEVYYALDDDQNTYGGKDADGNNVWYYFEENTDAREDAAEALDLDKVYSFRSRQMKVYCHLNPNTFEYSNKCSWIESLFAFKYHESVCVGKEGDRLYFYSTITYNCAYDIGCEFDGGLYYGTICDEIYNHEGSLNNAFSDWCYEAFGTEFDEDGNATASSFDGQFILPVLGEGEPGYFGCTDDCVADPFGTNGAFTPYFGMDTLWLDISEETYDAYFAQIEALDEKPTLGEGYGIYRQATTNGTVIYLISDYYDEYGTLDGNPVSGFEVYFVFIESAAE